MDTARARFVSYQYIANLVTVILHLCVVRYQYPKRILHSRNFELSVLAPKANVKDGI